MILNDSDVLNNVFQQLEKARKDTPLSSLPLSIHDDILSHYKDQAKKAGRSHHKPRAIVSRLLKTCCSAPTGSIRLDHLFRYKNYSVLSDAHFAFFLDSSRFPFDDSFYASSEECETMAASISRVIPPISSLWDSVELSRFDISLCNLKHGEIVRSFEDVAVGLVSHPGNFIILNRFTLQTVMELFDVQKATILFSPCSYSPALIQFYKLGFAVLSLMNCAPSCFISAEAERIYSGLPSSRS